MHAISLVFGRMARSNAVRLTVVAFVIYNANLRSVTSLDTYATRFIPISIVKEGDLDLDEFPFLHRHPAWLTAGGARPPYWIRLTRGHSMSNYPVMPAVLSVPFYAVPVMLGLTDGPGVSGEYARTEIAATLLAKLSASAAVALSVGVVFLTALRVTSRRGALWTAIGYGFATSSWSVSSQGLWQTAWSQPLLALSLYCLIRARTDPRFVRFAGAALALAVACRPPTIIFAVCLAGYVWVRHRRQAGAFLVVPAIVAALLLTYNVYYFESLIGGYTAVGGTTGFSPPRLEAFLGLLISPSRGLFAYSPVLLFAGAGLCVGLARRDPLVTAVAAASFLTVVFYASWEQWDGAFSYSYRLLVDLLPGLSLLIAAGWEWTASRRLRVGAFGLAMLFSVLIQVVGAVCFPCEWGSKPRSAARHRERFWDWSDPEWLRCLRAGPVEPEILRLVKRRLGVRGDGRDTGEVDAVAR